MSTVAPTPLESWLRQHLPGLMSRVELGIFCAGQQVRLDEIASPLLPLQETVDRLTAHLGSGRRLRRFALALLNDEVAGVAARERGLPQVLGLGGSEGKPRQARLCHRLLRAAKWVGRLAELSTLDWAWQEGARVIALRGPAGSGKTAIVQHWLDGRGLSDPRRWHDFGVEGLFVWSFASDPDVAGFLRAAADYVEGRAPPEEQPTSEDVAAVADLRRLLRALEQASGHILLVLDGLERFQAPEPPPLPPDLAGPEPPPTQPGEIVDPRLRRLLIEMAAVDGEAALLCTIERDIPSLLPWRGSGYVPVGLPPLPVRDGLELLRLAGVSRGTDGDAERRVSEHAGHALTLDLFGRFLGAYYQGDARAVTVSDLPPNDSTRLPESPTLRRVLRAHLQALTEPLRGLLELCVILPGPVRVSSLLALSQVAGEHPQGGALAIDSVLHPLRGVDAEVLHERLGELARLGLVQVGGAGDRAQVDIHPLVRQELYRIWIDARSGRASSSSSSSLSQGDLLPRPQDLVLLELVEQLVLVTLEAGLLHEAYDLLCVRLGGYPHLGRGLGEYRRLLSILRILSPVLCTVAEGDVTWTRRCARIAAWEAEALRDLGQLGDAIEVAQRSLGSEREPLPGADGWVIDSHLGAGRLLQAAELARRSLHASRSVAARVQAAVQQARSLLLLGEVSLCRVYLMEAALTLKEEPHAVCERAGVPLWELVDRERVHYLLRISDVAPARPILQRCQASALRDGRGKDLAEVHILLGEIARRERDPLDASQFVHRALGWGSRTGDAEMLVRAGLCHARIRMDAGNLDGAASVVGMALPAAVEHGLGIDRIDLLLMRGHLLLRRGDLAGAEADARDALAYAMAPECRYLWGEADALHLLAMVLLSGRPAGARIVEAATHLADELELREQMLDPRAHDVRWLLRRLTG
ncbi:MAG: NACHT domain-containing protein [Myxococcales bacterium]|nr:NACHT domain-containing protein [Myxococcales bacterium]